MLEIFPLVLKAAMYMETWQPPIIWKLGNHQVYGNLATTNVYGNLATTNVYGNLATTSYMETWQPPIICDSLHFSWMLKDSQKVHRSYFLLNRFLYLFPN